MCGLNCQTKVNTVNASLSILFSSLHKCYLPFPEMVPQFLLPQAVFSFKYLSLSSETVSCLTLCLRRNSQHLPCNQNLSARSQSRPLCCVCLGKHHRLHFVQWSINTFSSTSVVKMWQVTNRKLRQSSFSGSLQ